ncbi:ABC transporter permease [Pinibacter aurantiacus]|uniref:ABC transporter permease n=1 Tax=Pinibacter aurantiacus TaxID=2851599 RepID=A0A9E2W940_9BACT|nr:ABC transporter permease [Pinibacter aurantiacus]MBV4359506.1 ABC transporter permease [Pinibacter aurantiacus]
MIKNYLKIAFRNLWRHRVFSFINILGLTVGMTACFLIFLYVKFELSYDKFNSKAANIYRLNTDIKTPSETINTSVTAWPFAPNIKREFPEVETFTRVNNGSFLVRKGDAKFQEDNTLFADSTFFDVFDIKMLKGDPKKALKDMFSIVFTEDAAKKYFGNEDPIGKQVLLTGDGIPSTVTGIIQNIPENSILKGDMLVSMSTLTQHLNKGLDQQWGNFGATSFLLLKPGVDPRAMEKKFPDFIERNNGKERKESQMFYTFTLEPLKDIYLLSTRDGNKLGNMNNVDIFSIIAVFILLIACINFINLTTARSSERAKEVGIRKVVGAAKSQVARQFIGESVILCIIAFLLTVLLSVLLLPLFNKLAGKVVSHGIFTNWQYLLLLFSAAIGIGVLAGAYPALILSSFKPVVVLKGRFATGTKGILLRKGLVIAQFSISVVLIIATLVVYSQMSYMRKRDLGFSKDQMLVVSTQGDPARFALKNAVNSLPNVKSTALSSSVPGSGNPGAYSEIENKKGDLQIANLDLYFVDWNYIPQYKIKMVAGRSFSKDFGTDTTQAMVVNESVTKLLGYSSPQEAVGRKFKQWGREGKIIGVMQDFHFRSLQQPIKPLTMRIEPDGCDLLSVNITGGNVPATLASIEKKWKEMIPNRPFSYFFMDEFFDRQYRGEERFGNLFLNFAILAIFISCLGLLGLASYSTMQRTKEIGVRKVLGASVTNITALLSSDFIKLVLIAIVIASPLAYIGMHKWLEGFAYRTSVSWWVFLLAALTAIFIALFTVSFQAIKAAVANPVKSLRSE